METELQVIDSQPVTLHESSPDYGTQNNSEIIKAIIPRRKGWQPGQSGNPGGRPKTAEIRDLVLQEFKKDPKSNIQMLKRERIDLFFAYGFGKPVDRLELSGPDGGKIEVHQTSAEDSVRALAAMGIVLPG